MRSSVDRVVKGGSYRIKCLESERYEPFVVLSRAGGGGGYTRLLAGRQTGRRPGRVAGR